jgi:uncharacterized protein (TIGR02284 family)
MNYEKAMDVLYTLIEANNYRMEGYKIASREIAETDLKIVFSEFEKTSQNCKAELIAEVSKLGGTFIDGAKITGKFFKTWMDVKVASGGEDRNTMISLYEEGEIIALESYNHTLKNNLKDINSDQHAIIVAQQSLIRADYRKLKGMRNIVKEQTRRLLELK